MTRMNAAAAIDSARATIEIAQALAGVLVRETGHLKAMQPGAIRDFQDEKTRLADAYHRHASALRSPEVLAEMTPSLRAELRDAVEQFEQAAQANAIALRAATEANRRLVQAIADAVAELKAPVPAYGKSGAFQRPVSTGATVLHLNQKL